MEPSTADGASLDYFKTEFLILLKFAHLDFPWFFTYWDQKWAILDFIGSQNVQFMMNLQGQE